MKLSAYATNIIPSISTEKQLYLLGSINNKDADSRLKKYSTALIRQYENESSKKKLNIEYKKLFDDYQLGELEEEAQTKARFTSRIFTTVEAKSYRENMQHTLDQLFNYDETDKDTIDVEQLNLQSHLEDEEEMLSQEGRAEVQSLVPAGSLTNGPLAEEEKEFPTLKFVKEKNVYKYQAPANNITSPHKPIIQASDLCVLKEYFDICIGTNQDEATKETKQEFKLYINEQSFYKCLI